MLSTLHENISAMEPLIPSAGRGKLSELTCDILREAGGLSRALPSPVARTEVRRLVREMNSYYSNLIEGHKTFPQDIERALKDDFSAVPEKKNNQLLSRAHVEVEGLMEKRVEEGELEIHSSEFLCWLHGEFYRRLPDALHWAETESGKKYRIEPGVLRSFEVTVGSHHAPRHGVLGDFLDRFAAFYDDPGILATDRLIAVAAAHHRLAWIHPFGDGNGRVIRLHSHALLIRNRVDGLGLWTLSRGLARARQEYYERLRGADHRRQGDYDGRGNLSEKGLVAFCEFFLETMLDQIRFMGELLDLQNLTRRIDSWFEREAFHIPRYREEMSRLVRALLVEGEIPRTRVLDIISKGETLTRRVIKAAVEEGVIATPSERGKLSIAFPSKVVESYFPKLFLDLPVG